MAWTHETAPNPDHDAPDGANGTRLRVRYTVRGGHIHCRIFSGNPDQTMAKCGDMKFSDLEWPRVKARLEQCAEVLEEEEGQ